jgi:small ligand-binding sensory domain FIST
VAERDPDSIKQDIDKARDQLASTVDSLAVRANPRRLADDAKARVIGFVKKPVVVISLAGIAALAAALTVRRIRNK